MNEDVRDRIISFDLLYSVVGQENGPVRAITVDVDAMLV